MYTLKSIARRGTLLGAAGALLVATIVPAAPAFAAELNPLTERSLLLSSSAPGYVDTDGSNYSTASPNPAANPPNIPGTYAPAGSGPNGKKSGQTFTFRASSDDTIKGFTFQYCTTAAGKCQSPGNNLGDARSGASVARETNAVAHPLGRSDLNVTGGANVFTQATGVPPGAGQFQISVENNGVYEEVNSGWTMTAANREDQDFAMTDPDDARLSGKNNYVTLTNSTGYAIEPGDRVKVQFTASEDSYITNPGSGSFFVKINTYNDNSTLDSTTNVDGGVTVANVMTDSIHITTKVLETMAFSVGTKNRDTEELTSGQTHGTCDAIIQERNNRLDLGNPSAENSLETGRAWDVSSYWRLSSNSSGGATVYYSGNTLANTVGDEIAAMQTKAVSQPGTEQFGLGFDNAGSDSGVDALSTSFKANLTNPRYKVPTSFPFATMTSQVGTGNFAGMTAQPVSSDYADAALPATINGTNGSAGTAQFKFLPSSLTVPEPIAQQNQQVISCATAKMRYVANIGADTPAGVYTTKINYLAAPQY